MVDFRDMMQAVCKAGSTPGGLSIGIGPGCDFGAAAAGVVSVQGEDGHGAHLEHGMKSLSL